MIDIDIVNLVRYLRKAEAVCDDIPLSKPNTKDFEDHEEIKHLLDTALSIANRIHKRHVK